MPKTTPWLWFDTEAEDAANYYVSIFPNSRVTQIDYYGEAGPRPAGMVVAVEFELDGRDYAALNGGPEFKFNEAISFLIHCQDQEEVDYYWEKLGQGGEHGPCGWLKDKYGVSWQVVPDALETLSRDPDPAKAQAVTAAMLKMGKIEVAELQAAYDSA